MEFDDRELLERTYKIARENNDMLRSMRRNAFIGGIIKIIIWVLVLGLPIWFYLQFIHPTLESTLNTFEEVQGTGAQFSAQFDDIRSFFEQFGGGSSDEEQAE